MRIDQNATADPQQLLTLLAVALSRMESQMELGQADFAYIADLSVEINLNPGTQRVGLRLIHKIPTPLLDEEAVSDWVSENGGVSEEGDGLGA